MRASRLDPYEDYLLERWSQGERNAAQLYREINERGHPGSATMVRERKHQALRSWMKEVIRSGIPELKSFVAGIERDYDAIHAALLRAIEIARSQQARSLELRATMSLARLWITQKRGDDARRRLGDVYSWFTEGFETPDLQAAQLLLAQL